MATLTLERARTLFAGRRRCVYLNTAAECLFARPHADALARYARDRELGVRGREAHARVEARCRERVAALIGGRPQDVAFVASTARGVDAVLQAVDWRPGDNLVLSDLEYPTNVFAALKLRERGVEARVVPSPNGAVDLERLAARVDGRTRVLLASLVSWSSGFRHDLAPLSALARAHGAWLLVDGVQAVGATPVQCADVDFLAAGTYKWLLGSHGAAILYVNRRLQEQVSPRYVGWRGVADMFADDRLSRYALHADARRFEEGMPSYPALYVLDSALELLLALGITRISAHLDALTQRLVDGLERLGADVLTPRDPERRAGIVAVASPRCAEIAAALDERDIVVWGKDGRLRASPHLYNTEADVDAFLEALASLGPAAGVAAA